MRIKDLYESKTYNFDDFIDKESDNGLSFDLSEDLVYFMNHDDDTYRRHVFPSVTKCLNRIRENKKTTPLMFRQATIESYKDYCKKFPIRVLPDDLDNDTLTSVCKLIHEELCTHESDGKYKE